VCGCRHAPRLANQCADAKPIRSASASATSRHYRQAQHHQLGLRPRQADPAYTRQALSASLERLRIKRIDLWQLPRIDPKVLREEQFKTC
jgi:aryl-alcohol dehydrogenase-like predicted oxidoreductase